jgi:hypothetical protein
LQVNYQQDQYYLEFQNIHVETIANLKAGKPIKTLEDEISSKIKREIKSKSDLLKGIHFMEKQSELDHFRQENTLITKVDYETDLDSLVLKDQVVSRMATTQYQVDKNIQRNITFMALNSSFVYYTKLMFIKHDESGLNLQLDLFSMISASEQVPANPITGKAQLQVDDA